jgi:hypothetical protein
MELHREKRKRSVRDSLDGVIVEAAKGGFPLFRECFFIDGVSVILRGQNAFFLF